MAEEKPYALASLFGSTFGNLVHHAPHARFLDLQVVETGPCFAELRLPYRDELIGDPQRGVVFGGVITTLIDQASGLAVACSLKEMTAIATIDLRIDYLRAATPGCDLFARSTCYRLTRSVAFVHATAWETDREDPFAGCLATFMLGANTAGSPMATRLRNIEEGSR